MQIACVLKRAAMDDKEVMGCALKACGGSKAELARRAGVSRQAVQYWFKQGRLGRWTRPAVETIAGVSGSSGVAAA